MLLHSLEILGFKGIRDLTINFNKDISVLIGENSWGSTSLLSALSIISPENFLYDCQKHDFYYEEDCPDDCLTLRFTYVDDSSTTEEIAQNNPLFEVIYFSRQLRKQVVCYQVRATKTNGSIETEHSFIDTHRKIIAVENFAEHLRYLIDMNPLIMFKEQLSAKQLSNGYGARAKDAYHSLVEQLMKDAEQLSRKEVQQGLSAATLLLTYYLTNQKNYEEPIRKPTLEDWQILDKINDLLDRVDSSITRNMMMDFFANMIFHRMGFELLEGASPILVFKNFGGNMHPIITSVGMRLLKNISVQKILTSHTSDLIPMLSLQNVMRISRSDSSVVVNQVLPKDISSSTNRKVLFHVFHRRPVALFARCWFLVEGETEIWLLRELAEICGHNLNAEGIALIEFAQCGILPLIEYAEAMGIEWYVMADGDAAGRHYAKSVRSHCKDKEHYYRHMTQLPSRDIENFLFQKGFSSVYKQVAYGSTEFVNLPVHEIIQRAVQKSSKPDLALAVCDFARTRGTELIPSLLQKTFKKVIELSKGFIKNE